MASHHECSSIWRWSLVTASRNSEQSATHVCGQVRSNRLKATGRFWQDACPESPALRAAHNEDRDVRNCGTGGNMRYLLASAILALMVQSSGAAECMPCMTKCSICFNAGKPASRRIGLGEPTGGEPGTRPVLATCGISRFLSNEQALKLGRCPVGFGARSSISTRVLIVGGNS